MGLKSIRELANEAGEGGIGMIFVEGRLSNRIQMVGPRPLSWRCCVVQGLRVWLLLMRELSLAELGGGVGVAPLPCGGAQVVVGSLKLLMDGGGRLGRGGLPGLLLLLLLLQL